jgi:Saxitoxin biosynthesis operon protein SxtJ
MGRRGIHEDFARQERIEAGSDRIFGFVIGSASGIFSVLPLVHGGHLRTWLLGVGIAVLLAAVLKPGLLAPFNFVWFWIGKLLGMIVSPIVMAFIFFGAVTPIGAIVRWSGKDTLGLRRRSSSDTYWIERSRPSSVRETLKNQF